MKKQKFKFKNLTTIVICSFLIIFITGCNGTEVEKTTSKLSLKVPTGVPFMRDIFFTDPVLTEENNIVFLGTENSTIVSYRYNYHALFFMNDSNNATNRYFIKDKNVDKVGTKLEVNLTDNTFHQSTNPPWTQNLISTQTLFLKQIHSMTMDPSSQYIYLLVEKCHEIEKDVNFEDADIDELMGTHQEIEIIKDGKIEKNFVIENETHFEKIRYFYTTYGDNCLLATDTKGNIYEIELNEDSRLFKPYDGDIPPLISWDLVNTVLVGLDNNNQLHIYNLSSNSVNEITIHEETSIQCPLQKKLKKLIHLLKKLLGGK
jgi:hypothetical protein